jgi:hypothetical protein
VTITAQGANPADGHGITRDAAVQIIFWLGVLMVLVFGVLAIGLSVRKKLLGDGPTTDEADTFTLSDLRRLHNEGKLTDDEYERAKDQDRRSDRNPDEEARNEPAAEVHLFRRRARRFLGHAFFAFHRFSGFLCRRFALGLCLGRGAA